MPWRYFLIVLASTVLPTAVLVLTDPANWGEKLAMGIFSFVGAVSTALGISFWGTPDTPTEQAKSGVPKAQHPEGKQ
ncbi:TPA: hypothetical protein VDU83_002561 [Pseudomonas aeruginosa]|nr:hypothetical protein [Pseudomonas aeruginosa]